MLYLQSLELFAAYMVLFAVCASHPVMELSWDVLEQLSQDALTSLGQANSFDLAFQVRWHVWSMMD